MRKKTVVLVLFAVLVAGCFMLSAQRARRTSRNVAAYNIPSESVFVDVYFQKPPAYSIDSKKTHIGSSSMGSGYAKEWLVSEITFSFSIPTNLKYSRPICFNDLRVELFLAVPSVKISSRRGEDFRWFYGFQVLHSVVVDPSKKAQKYMASLFMPPSYVYMYFPRDKADKYNLKALEGVVLFYDKDGVLIGGKAFDYRNRQTKTRGNQLLDYVEQFRKSKKMPIMLWPREKTPWQWLDADRFELPKTEFPASPPPGDAEKEGQGGAE